MVDSLVALSFFGIRLVCQQVGGHFAGKQATFATANFRLNLRSLNEMNKNSNTQVFPTCFKCVKAGKWKLIQKDQEREGKKNPEQSSDLFNKNKNVKEMTANKLRYH